MSEWNCYQKLNEQLLRMSAMQKKYREQMLVVLDNWIVGQNPIHIVGSTTESLIQMCCNSCWDNFFFERGVDHKLVQILISHEGWQNFRKNKVNFMRRFNKLDESWFQYYYYAGKKEKKKLNSAGIVFLLLQRMLSLFHLV